MVLRNTFHNTEYQTKKSEAFVTRLRQVPIDKMTDTERQWMRKVRRILCGGEKCTCARTQLGERYDR